MLCSVLIDYRRHLAATVQENSKFTYNKQKKKTKVNFQIKLLLFYHYPFFAGIANYTGSGHTKTKSGNMLSDIGILQ